jgi:hypothetical protein
VTTNVVASPDGKTTADRLTDTAPNIAHQVTQAFVKAASAIQYTAFTYSKYENLANIYIELASGAGGAGKIFNVQTGVVGSSVTFGVGFTLDAFSIEALANGWYKCSIVVTTDATAAVTLTLRMNGSSAYAGSGTGTNLFWGTQLVTGNQVGLINSYIPTTTVSVTRNADVLTYPTTGWLNAAAGTLYAEWFNPNNSGTYIQAAINDGTVNNNIRIFVSTITTATADVAQGGGFVSQLSAVALTGAAIAKVVNVYQVNDFAGFGNNTSLGTDALGAIPTVNSLQIGCQFSSSQLGHYIRKVSYIPQRVPSSTGQSWTV